MIAARVLARQARERADWLREQATCLEGEWVADCFSDDAFELGRLAALVEAQADAIDAARKLAENPNVRRLLGHRMFLTLESLDRALAVLEETP